MTELLHAIPQRQANRDPSPLALVHKNERLRYGELAERIDAAAAGFLSLGCERRDRIAIFLPKQFETVAAMFGAVRAGCVFVPVNPLLKAAQVAHILRDCNVRVLVTSSERFELLREELPHCVDLRHVVVVGNDASLPDVKTPQVLSWHALLGAGQAPRAHRVVDTDMAAILYTSGSTGKPKGVVLSHRNMVTGAHSVAQYLGNTAEDRLLAALPFSFDYGFSQLSTAFHVGASVTLMDYLFPKDILTALAKERITGLAGVPPLWAQLSELQWPAESTSHLRYITNSGGAMPGSTLSKLRATLPKAQVFLMYGLTEAFRSTYLPPSEIDKRPGSMGKAIPNAEILVVRPDGTPCEPNEPGELVHRGSLVALGYWGDSEKTQLRFRPAPGLPDGLRIPEIAVWSGDTVRADEDGFLYFVGRKDEMIKTSGYRVSPTEVEEVVFGSGLVGDAAAVGVKHAKLGQAIVVVATPAAGRTPESKAVLDHCRKELPAFMVPTRVEWRDHLPRNPNGKYDRPKLAVELADLFENDKAE